ncbi:MAG TPA: iron-containing alcohol dehydrogenase, partial [Candidatus Limnocylindrales bacterium]
ERLDGPVAAFTVGRLPRVLFGAGRRAELPSLVAAHGRRALLVTGARSLLATPWWTELTAGLDEAGVTWDRLGVHGEPSPELVDGAVAARRADPPDVVVGIGGGAALDAGKAIAGLLRSGTVALDHLEGIGRGIPYPGPSTPFIAVPTTAGTGSEVTRNAVLSGQTAAGGGPPAPFKKSFRDDRLVAATAIVDPDLVAGCPPALIAGDGMDALTQCLEAYVSTGASPYTDAIARSGLAAIGPALPAWHAAALDGRPPAEAAAFRSAMAWGALASGIALANAGLGAVHGMIAALGVRHGIHHGTGCGILLAAATRVNLEALRARDPDGPALRRYAEAGRLLVEDPSLRGDDAADALVHWLVTLTTQLGLPRLADVGVREADLAALVADSRGSSMRTNPIVLADSEIATILTDSL